MTPPRWMRRLAPLVFAAALGSLAHAQYAWPEQVVKVEEMKILTPLRVEVDGLTRKAEVRGPAVLKMHVGSAGEVVHVALLQSSGSPLHDEAAMLAMRGARFQPKLVDGAAKEVTLVVPLHLPKMKHQTR